MSGRGRTSAPPRRRSWPLALVFALLGTAASAGGALHWQHSIEQARVRLVDAGVAASVDAVTTSLTNLSRESHDSVEFFSPRNVNRGTLFDWSTRYVAAQTQTPGMSALLYVQNVNDADLAAFTEAFHAEVGTQVTLIVIPGPVHEIIARGQPTQALGVDLLIAPTVQPLLDVASAALTGAVIESAPKQVTDFLPVATPGEAFVIGLADRDAAGNVIGWGVASFSGPGVILVAHRQMPAAYGISVEANISGEIVVIGSVPATGAAGPEVVRQLHIEGLETAVTLRVTPPLIVNDRFLSAGPTGLLVSGVAVALLLAGLLLVIVGSRSKALAMVDEAVAGLSASERRLASLVDHSADAVAIIDHELIVRFITPAVERLLGLEVTDVEGRRLNFALPFEDANVLCEELLALPGGATLSSERVLMRADGADITAEVTARNLVADAAVAGYVLTIHDMTDRKLYEQLLHHQAAHDPLTGLPNRSRLPSVADSAREAAHRRDGTYAVLYVDLDRFKEVNDDHGHGVGDEVLRVVASRLGRAIRPVDTVFRVGGDEFVVICPGANETIGRRVADRVENAINELIVVTGLDLSIGASIGVVVGRPEDDPELLVLSADRAMYREKSLRRA
jgi:diguanylate cyclase (GGDEF)-like protein/PAS domain S-box-containing protein